MNNNSKIKYFLLVSSITIYLVIMLLLFFDKVSFFDAFVYKNISYLENDTLTYFFKFISLLCDKKIIVLVCLLLFLSLNKKIGSYIFFSASFNYIINVFIKIIIKRARPINSSIIEHGFSFPSGHAMASIAVYGYLFYFILKSNISKNLKRVSCSCLLLLILLIGLSRIYLGVHYASDVIAGYCLALFLLVIFIGIVKKIERN